MNRGVIFLFCVMLTAAFVRAAIAGTLSDEQRKQTLSEAQADYDKGVSLKRDQGDAAKKSFESAAQRFQLLVDDGVVNGPVLFDLGTAYMQAGDLGKAILNYKRAERLMGSDEHLHTNLEYARSQCRTQVQASAEGAIGGVLRRWHERFSLWTRLVVFGGAYLCFWGALMVRMKRRGRVLGFVLAVALPVWIVSGASAAVDVFGLMPNRNGVVVADNVVVRKGNGEGFDAQFNEPLHEGVEFKTIEVRGDWANIELPDGKTGWLQTSAVEFVDPQAVRS
ncbi:MAG TPA: hypothetical protein VG711_09385 [Phycisphaerales bacterium]|nr:hypothetical protein [Phycisphaerales bacterium]